ncbi:hypothetical protein N7471_013707 [Penicillium samsonianum]|uniref:uncharacterized protein n=1 Tax=Penicillium samsonianum TaxID=1882272 RepID=UPI0025489A64|nr:uncharacterized protein N7471_013707 [Penicillium samsonianum]KAJ6118240.1 hypothetical protein N7471_013707 [Penicillium samsonianum]
MSTNRYIVPIPESMMVMKTRKYLNDFADHHQDGWMDIQNGGWVYVDGNEKVLAVASDSLCCEELDVREAEIQALGDEDGEDFCCSTEQSNPDLSNQCKHHRCFNTVICVTYNGCHVCSRNNRCF